MATVKKMSLKVLVTDGFLGGFQGKVAKVILGLSQGVFFALKLFICLFVCFFSLTIFPARGRIIWKGMLAVMHTKLCL